EQLNLMRDQLKGQQAHLQLQDMEVQQKLATAIRNQQLQEQVSGNIPGLFPDLSSDQHAFLGSALKLGGLEGMQKAADFFRQQADARLLNGAQGSQGGTVPPMPQVSPLTGPQGNAGDTSYSVGSTYNVGPGVSQPFLDKVQQVAGRLQMNPSDLMKIMHFETGGA